MVAFSKQLLQQQRELLANPQKKPHFTPIKTSHHPTHEDQIAGETLLSKGKVACLILAGGVGSRLGSPLPKALIPITSIRKKTLLQLICEKTAAASQAFKVPLQIALMTSSLNHEEIKSELVKNDYFGLDPLNVNIFIQDNAPLLDEQGDWFHDAQGEVAVGPDGNGHCLKKLIESKIGKKWKELGIEHVMLVPIDNPLADPFDTSLCGAHFLSKSDATIKAIFRTDPQEKLSILALDEHKVLVIEYFDLPPHLEAPLGNSGMYCFDMTFVERIASMDLPWHMVRKKQGVKNVYKFERLIIDVFPHAEKCAIVAYPREEVFAPLKNEVGPDSLSTVREALLNHDRKIFTTITQTPPPSRPFELDPAFYYPTAQLKAKWKGKKAPDIDYISP